MRERFLFLLFKRVHSSFAFLLFLDRLLSFCKDDGVGSETLDFFYAAFDCGLTYQLEQLRGIS